MFYYKSIATIAFILYGTILTNLALATDIDELETETQKNPHTKIPQAPKIKKRFIAQQMMPAPISISYRSDGEGKGAFYDHYTVQLSTKHETQLMKAPGMTSILHRFAKQQTFNLPYGKEDKETQKKLPPMIEGWDENGGLLFIPGRPRIDASRTREVFEQKIIRRAMLTGRPILAVCGGAWRLWEAYGGTTKEIKDHNYSGGMLRLNECGVVTYNIPIHDIKTVPHTLLTSIMNKNSAQEVRKAVNSVHWLAPDDNASVTLPSNKDQHTHFKALYELLQVSARSIANPNISLKTRQGEVMKPEEETVEAFETLRGSPIVGIQWHPEAYCRYKEGTNIYYDSKHNSILKFMADAGDAYAARRRMTKEFMDLRVTLLRRYKDKRQINIAKLRKEIFKELASK
ncbi:MAG TPA: gamma-glutamyl-gamma-aminobutyrate hydrolase family protein [Alphaproteobacteria bacterium]|nr:gamma-glutamyl-gamma-aminobutyrate hydrolase family protein [Alphaproteobacteria bacterium]